MNDDQLATLISEQRDSIPMTATIDAVVRRGQHIRHRRRAAWAGGTLAVAAAPAVIVGVGSRPAQSPTAAGPTHATSIPKARLAAWTVSEEASGEVDVTINQLKDPSGLQQTLRDDGVPVNVSSTMPRASCQPDNTDFATLKAVAQIEDTDGAAHLVIDPAALPSGVGLAIFDDPGSGPSNPPLPAGDGAPPNLPAGAGSVPSLAPPTGVKPAFTPNPAAGTLLRALDGPFAIGLVNTSPDCTG